METLTPQKQMAAVIDIGSSALRMMIAEIGPKSEIRYIENLQKPVPLGKDVFTTGRISATTIRESIEVLKNYRSLIDGYSIHKIHAIATSAVRDAANRENFIDQVFVRTNLDVEVLEGAEENRLELIAVEHGLGESFDFTKKNCLIVEVGSGSTEIIIMKKGEVELTRTLSIGSIRLPEHSGSSKMDSSAIQKHLKRNIHEIAQNTARECSLGDIDTFIALGADMRFVARQLLETIESGYIEFDQKRYLNFIGQLAKMSTEEIAEKYALVYSEAEAFYPALLFYAYFLGETAADKIIVPMVSIRDGILIELAQMLSGYKRTDVSKQVISSAKRLAKKYNYDEPHAAITASLAVKLFDLLKEDHGLGSKERLLLEVAAYLHDIGMYISPTSHHKHSSYLVDAAELFGLRKSDKNIVSNVIRYHRRSTPQASHTAYMSLPRQDRSIVSKLAAILRVADSLDKSHQQKIRNFTFERTSQGIALWVTDDVGDISLERDVLSKKGMMFQEVFGASIVLKQGKPKG
ncbi:MAG: HD domain-containing protein [Candidatus Omnitrophica bacterium]|nr:HD domain-containing protein [Candidatus Omnitrophota bacterium]